MKCGDFDRLLCDYLDDTLGIDDRREMDGHRLVCTSCAETFEETEFALAALRLTPAVEPPPQLIADIIHDTIGVGAGALEPAVAGGGAFGFLRPLFQPLQQPRFVMGMAMTALSFSMLTFYGQQAWNDLRNPQQRSAATAAESFRHNVTGLWGQAVEMTASTRDFYVLQTERVLEEARQEGSE
jgi:hypothetical protein